MQADFQSMTSSLIAVAAVHVPDETDIDQKAGKFHEIQGADDEPKRCKSSLYQPSTQLYFNVHLTLFVNDYRR